ncbi:GntR family transcriptional regulator [Thalassobacillus pellis]|uniref:GntR family transcriptional regulator n=1 Tax=Thalassobacillus pellis TaxID=748008 RepID=UPI00195FD52E|nr:GntR family transcriptional regulator [Thalassobacillus pellis]MBM7553148.1 GntR family transcriptional regulator of arabinose operon [Thalassobacillus pellis]
METKYNIVKQAIMSKILDGTIRPNQKISSETELMNEFNVSRHTVRLAIGDLVTRGWLYRTQGAGTFCADRLHNESNTNSDSAKTIAIITTYISDYIFPSIIRGAEAYLSENGYHVTLFSTNNNHDDERKFLEKVISRQFDGVIVEPTRSAFSNPNIKYYLNLERLKIPYLMINAYYDELEPISLTMDDEKGGFLQTEHLIKQGHRNIVGFFKTDDIQGTKRMKGYLKAHRTYEVPLNPNHIITYNTAEKKDKPTEELRKLLAKNNQDTPTAIVCYNDELAINLLDVIRGMGLKVPDNISIVGYDDSFLSNVSEVKLTTVEHPKSEMGKAAGKVIIDLIKDKNKAEGKIESIVYEPKLIVRNSTKELKE